MRAFMTVILLLSATPAIAQAPTFGAPTPGICLFAHQVALGRSRAGIAANRQLIDQANVAAQAAAVTEAAIAADRAAILRRGEKAADYPRRVAALQQRIAQAGADAAARARDFDAARARGTQAIDAALSRVLARVIDGRACAVVFERSGAHAWNKALDITDQVVADLDAGGVR